MTTKTDCACARCVQACRDNPGWMQPDDARQAIENGLAERLMLDWLEPSSEVGNDDRIYVLAPASKGCEGDYAPEIEGSFATLFMGGWTKGRCVFLQSDDRCELHATGFKPKQCAETMACGGVGPDNYEMARLWDNDEARALVSSWRKSVNL